MAKHSLGPPATLPDGSSNPLSLVYRAGDFVYVSGLMPRDENGLMVEGDITRQTTEVLRRLRAALALAECTLADVVKVTVWLVDAADFPAFNAAYAAHFDPPYPARSALRGDLLLEGARLELEAIAYKPRADRRSQ